MKTTATAVEAGWSYNTLLQDFFSYYRNPSLSYPLDDESREQEYPPLSTLSSVREGFLKFQISFRLVCLKLWNPYSGPVLKVDVQVVS